MMRTEVEKFAACDQTRKSLFAPCDGSRIDFHHFLLVMTPCERRTAKTEWLPPALPFFGRSNSILDVAGQQLASQALLD